MIQCALQGDGACPFCGGTTAGPCSMSKAVFDWDYEAKLERLRQEALAGKPPSQEQAEVPTHGPGTELKKILAKIRITASHDCKCNARARYMDDMEANEPGWCERNIEEIVGYLREAAADRGLPFLDVAGRLLIRRAIANAKRAALDAPATVAGERESDAPQAAEGEDAAV